MIGSNLFTNNFIYGFARLLFVYLRWWAYVLGKFNLYKMLLKWMVIC